MCIEGNSIMLCLFLFYSIKFCICHMISESGVQCCPPLIICRRNPIAIPSSCRTLLLGLDCIVFPPRRGLLSILFSCNGSLILACSEQVSVCMAPLSSFVVTPTKSNTNVRGRCASSGLASVTFPPIYVFQSRQSYTPSPVDPPRRIPSLPKVGQCNI